MSFSFLSKADNVWSTKTSETKRLAEIMEPRASNPRAMCSVNRDFLLSDNPSHSTLGYQDVEVAMGAEENISGRIMPLP